MYVLPVLDLLQGVVVRGVAGRRADYRPLQSRLCASADPLTVATAFRDQFGFDQLYVADLDAILDQRPNLPIYRQLVQAGFTILVDAGIRRTSDAAAVLQSGADSIIAGLESISDPELLGDLVTHCGVHRVIFSLDLNAGQPMIGGDSWQGLTPLRIGEIAWRQGIRRLIVLDLAQVGVAGGVTTLDLCAALRRNSAELELLTGGGVRGPNDLDLLEKSHIDGVLLASALHDGRLTPGDLKGVTNRRILPQ